jgi:hypothetical protein
MKKATGLIIAAIAAGAIYFFAKTKKLAASAKFTIKGIKLQGINKVVINVGVLNPTGTTVTFNSFVGELITKGNAIASVTGFQKTEITANSESIVPITFTLSGVGVLSLAKKLLTKGGLKTLQASLIGTANISGTALPVNIPLA